MFKNKIKLFLESDLFYIILIFISFLFFWHDYLFNLTKDIFYGDYLLYYKGRHFFLWLAYQSHFLADLNPFLGGGEDFLSNIQFSFFYPFNLFFLIPNFEIAHRIFLYVHYFWVGIGFYLLFSKYFKFDKYVALIGAYFGMFNGFPISTLTMFNSLKVYSWVPWVLFGVLKFIETEKFSWRYFWLIIVSNFALILGGEPQIAGLTWLIVVVFVFQENFSKFRKDLKWAFKKISNIVFAYFIVILLTFHQLLPFFMSLKSSIRGFLSVKDIFKWSLDPISLVTLVFPNFYLSIEPFFASRVQWLESLYISSIGVLLLIVSFRYFKKKILIFITIIIGVLLSLGKYTAFSKVILLLPIINKARYPNKYFFVVLILSIYLIVFTLNELIKNGISIKNVRKFVLLGLLLSLVSLGYYFNIGHLLIAKLVKYHFNLSSFERFHNELLKYLLLFSFSLLIIPSIIFFNKKYRYKILSSSLVFVVFLSFYIPHNNYYRLRDFKSKYSKNTENNILSSIKKPYSLYVLRARADSTYIYKNKKNEDIIFNEQMKFFSPTLNILHMIPVWNSLNVLRGIDVNFLDDFSSISKISNSVDTAYIEYFKMMNINYILTPNMNLPISDFKKHQAYVEYFIDNPYPKIYLPNKVNYLNYGNLNLLFKNFADSLLRKHNDENLKYVILDSLDLDTSFALDFDIRKNGGKEIKYDVLDNKTIKFKLLKKSLVVFDFHYDKKWTLFSKNGDTQKLYRANIVGMASILPKGEYTLRYENKTYRKYVLFFCFVVFILIFANLMAKCKERCWMRKNK